jgi:phenylalanine-4-hydroxylase
MTQQLYAQYTPADQSVWSLLYKRQINIIEDVSYPYFIKGVHQLGFNENAIPDFNEINKRLEKISGWKIYAVPGLIEASDFFKLMLQKQFGATTWIRKMEELDYLEEPDMFHDVFGHIPLLADPNVCDYLYKMAVIANRYISDAEIIEKISRLYWFTVEFGMVKDNNGVKIYGAGILSSPGETAFCLSEKANRVAFDLQKILDTTYRIDTFQEQYFVIESMGQLHDIILQLDGLLKNIYQTH